MRQPYTENWFFGIQRSLPGKIVVEANYIAAAGRHLVYIANGNRFAGDLLNGGIFHGYNQSFSSINMLDTGSSSIYHGGTFTVRKALSHGVMFQASYTYSKVLDESEDEQGVTSFSDMNNRRLDWSVASFNQPQRFSFNGYWDIPFLNTCKAWYCRAAGGWQISGYGIFDNGSPFSVASSGAYPNGDYNADGTTGDRPNAPLTPIQSSGFSREQLLTGIFPGATLAQQVALFPTPTLGTNGTLGRNTFRGPGFGRVDMALTKNFRVTERFNLRFRMEGSNAFNHTNLNNPSSATNSNTFGKVTASAASRQLRASLMRKALKNVATAGAGHSWDRGAPSAGTTHPDHRTSGRDHADSGHPADRPDHDPAHRERPASAHPIRWSPDQRKLGPARRNSAQPLRPPQRQMRRPHGEALGEPADHSRGGKRRPSRSGAQERCGHRQA